MNLEMPMLESERLYLRPVERADVADLFAIYGDERVMHKNTSMKAFQNIDEMMNSLNTHFLAYRQRCLPQSMALECKENGRVIGIIDFHTVKQDCGELGYMLAYANWHQGYMSEAIAGMLYLGFHYLDLHRIEAYYDPNNKASARTLAKNQFVIEGLHRKAFKLNDDAYHDLMVCSVLKEEYTVKKDTANYTLHIGGNEI